jgi:hypothetical protein
MHEWQKCYVEGLDLRKDYEIRRTLVEMIGKIQKRRMSDVLF